MYRQPMRQPMQQPRRDPCINVLLTLNLYPCYEVTFCDVNLTYLPATVQQAAKVCLHRKVLACSEQESATIRSVAVPAAAMDRKGDG